MVEFIKHLDEVAPGGRLIPVEREDIVVNEAPGAAGAPAPGTKGN